MCINCSPTPILRQNIPNGTLPETNIAPETLGLENELSFSEGLPAGAMLVFGRYWFMLIVEPLAYGQKWWEPLFHPGFPHPQTGLPWLILGRWPLGLRVGDVEPWGVCRGCYCEGCSDFLCWKRWCWCGILHFGRQCNAVFLQGKVIGSEFSTFHFENDVLMAPAIQRIFHLVQYP